MKIFVVVVTMAFTLGAFAQQRVRENIKQRAVIAQEEGSQISKSETKKERRERPRKRNGSGAKR